jgi:hypothetical protein
VIRVQIAEGFAFGFGVAILIADRPGDNAVGMPYRALRFGDGGSREWEQVTDVYAGHGPTLVLEEDEARALLDALTRYYNGAEDTRALRKDYDAERARVDKLTDAVIGVAHRLVGSDG